MTQFFKRRPRPFTRPSRTRRLLTEQLEARELLAFGIPELTNIRSTTPAATANASAQVSAASLSGDGHYQVFSSTASNIVSGDTNGTEDVFLKDLLTGNISLISRTATNTTANGTSNSAVISDDGNWVAFISNATNMNVTVPGATTGYDEVFLWHRTDGSLTIVSHNASGNDGAAGYASGVTISQDGSRLAYLSDATDLVTGFVDNSVGSGDVYMATISVGAGVTATNQLVSHKPGLPLQSLADEPSVSVSNTNPRISRNGSRVLYSTTSSLVQTGTNDNNLTVDLVSYEVATGLNQYVSVESTSAVTANADSLLNAQSLSDDGRYQVFTSNANDLVAGDTNQTSDVFLRDLSTGTLTLVSRNVAGQAANGGSSQPVISGSGRYVAFTSSASNLNVTSGQPNAAGYYNNVFRWDRTTGKVQLVSVASTYSSVTDAGGNDSSSSPVISQDGNRIAYSSNASNLVASLVDVTGTNSLDAYVRDVTAATTKLVNHTATSTTTTSNAGVSPNALKISRDGSTVVYRTGSSDLQSTVTDNNATDDVVAFTYSSGLNQYVSVESTTPSLGNNGSEQSARQSISEDGQWQVFSSSSSDLLSNDINQQSDVFLRNTATGALVLVSRASGNVSANGSSFGAVISGDGNYVLFASTASNLDVPVGQPNSDNGYSQVYRWNRGTGLIELVSRRINLAGDSASNIGSRGGDFEAWYPSVNVDGSRVAFASHATNLVAGFVDNNSIFSPYNGDIYLRDFVPAAPTTSLVSHISGSNFATGDQGVDHTSAVISRDGLRVTYATYATNILSSVTDLNGQLDIYSYLVSTKANQLVSRKNSATAGSQGIVGDFSVNDDGTKIAFTTAAIDILATSSAGNYQVYRRDITANTMTMVSLVGAVASSGSNLGGPSAMSGDGRYVAFTSADAMVPASGSNGHQQGYVRDLNAPVNTKLVTQTSGGTPSFGDTNWMSLSRDGTKVLFTTWASDVLAGISKLNGGYDVFVRDWQAATPQTRLVSKSSPSTSGNQSSDAPLGLSNDGSVISFASSASDLGGVLLDTNSTIDVFTYSYAFNILSPAAVKANAAFTVLYGSGSFDISGDGQIVAFEAASPSLAGAPINSSQVYRRNLITQTTTLASIDFSGTYSQNAFAPSISSDGRFITFQSPGQYSAQADNYQMQIFGFDSQLNTTVLVSKNMVGEAGGNYSDSPRISGDGSKIIFASLSSDLASGTDGATPQLFTRNWRAASPVTTWVSRNQAGQDQSGLNAYNMNFTGTRIAFDHTGNFVDSSTVDVNNSYDVYAFNTADSQIATVSAKSSGRYTTAGGTGGYRYDQSDNGLQVLFAGSGAMLDERVLGGSTWFQLYARDLSTQQNELIDIQPDGRAPLAGIYPISDFFTISGDGRYVGFNSWAELSSVPLLNFNYQGNAYVRDRGTSTIVPKTVLVGVKADGTDSDNHDGNVVISHDGSFVAFESYGSSLVTGITATTGQVYVRNWQATTPKTEILTRRSANTTSNNGDAFLRSISADGRVVAFTTDATNMVAGIADSNAATDVYVSKRLEVSAQPVTQPEGTGGGTTAFVFSVTPNTKPFTANTVAYATSNGTATAGSDFTSASGTLTFAAGSLTAQTITVQVNADSTDEPDETFPIFLSNATQATILTPGVLVTITNDDVAPGLSISDVTALEGNSGTKNFVFTVSLSEFSGKNITVQYASQDGTAKSPQDFGAVSGNLLFVPGETSKTITVAVVGETIDELNETFSVLLSNQTNAAMIKATGLGTITNDDNGPALTASGAVINGGAAQRSNVEKLVYQFSEATNLAALIAAGTITNAVQLYRSTGVQVPLTSSNYSYNAVTNTLTVDVTIDGTGISRQTMLTDGRYELRLSTALVTKIENPTKHLVDDDAAPTDNVRTTAFHRLEADFDGNAAVNYTDRDMLLSHYGLRTGQAGYDIAYDMDFDGYISTTDYTKWRKQLNKSL